MRPPKLCLERLQRIFRVLDRHDGELSVRDFNRSFGVWEWELQQATVLGWVRIEMRKPRTGRPSRVVIRETDVSKTQSAKLPSSRWMIRLLNPKEISIRQELFALHSISVVPSGGWFGFSLCSLVRAYQTVFPNARSYAGARASASRLRKHPNVGAARAWFFSKRGVEIPRHLPMPDTAKGIVQCLREHGSWRVQ